MRPSPRASTVTTGRTEASRATRHRSTRTGFHSPAVCRSGPQSQPNEHAIFRTMLYGCGYGDGRAPSRAASLSA